MTYHKTTSTILDLLKSHGVWFETFEHQQVRTSEEAAKIRHGYALSQGAKAMLVRVKNTNTDKRFLMLVVPGNIRFDTAKVKQLLTAKDIRFATEEEVGGNNAEATSPDRSSSWEHARRTLLGKKGDWEGPERSLKRGIVVGGFQRDWSGAEAVAALRKL